MKFSQENRSTEAQNIEHIRRA